MAHSFARGALPSPRHKLLAAIPHRVTQAPPPQFAVVPPKLAYWDNNQDGVCVSSEEAWAKAWWSTYCGLPEVFASDAEVRNFAARYGWLNGATLTEVMDVMVSTGMPIGGQTYRDGAYTAVDYSNEDVLHSALTQGPVKIAIDADALPQDAGNAQGWYALSGQHYGNTDHCVGIGGYGPASYLYDALKVSLPSGLSPSTPGYHLFTWSTIGFVSHDWLMGTCTEAWLRNPTTPGQTPSPTPGPGPGPQPAPVPPFFLFTGDPARPTPIGLSGGYSTLTMAGFVAHLLATFHQQSVLIEDSLKVLVETVQPPVFPWIF